MCRYGQKWMSSLCNQPPKRHTHLNTHMLTNKNTVVSLLLIFLTAVAIMHLQVIIGCLQPPCIMKLYSSSFLLSLFLSGKNVNACIHLYLVIRLHTATFNNGDKHTETQTEIHNHKLMHVVPQQHKLSLNWEDLQPERSVINAKHI